MFYISRGLENIISKCNNILNEESKQLFEKQLKKQSQILQKNVICEYDVFVYERNKKDKKEITSHIDILEILNRACNVYEHMWNIKTSKLRRLQNAEERSIIRNEIKYIKIKIDNIVEEMTLLIHVQLPNIIQGSLLDDYIDKFIQ